MTTTVEITVCQETHYDETCYCPHCGLFLCMDENCTEYGQHEVAHCDKAEQFPERHAICINHRRPAWHCCGEGIYRTNAWFNKERRAYLGIR